MLNEWERRQWADIAQELAGDRGLTRRLAPPSAHERRWLGVRRWFYPMGYLASAFVFMLLAMGGAQLGLVVETLVAVTAIWLLVEFRSNLRR